jgi:hypothetical protein
VDGRDPRAGGFGERGIEGKIPAVRFAREKKVPYLGICLGMQVAIIEYARHVLGLHDANSTEFNRQTPHPVIAMITEWQDQAQAAQARTSASNRAHHALGAQEVLLARARACARSTAREIHASVTAIATSSTTTSGALPERGPAFLRLLARRVCRDDRAAEPSVVRRLAVPSRSSRPIRATGIRFFTSFIKRARA